MKKIIIALFFLLAFAVTSHSAEFFTNGEPITFTTYGSWASLDLSSYLPTTATGVIMLVKNTHASIDYAIGLKKLSGSTGYTNKLKCWHQTYMYMGVHTDRTLYAYKGNAAIEFYLMGYFTSDAVFFDSPYDVSITSSTGTWLNLPNIESYLPAGAIAAIIEVVSANDTTYQFGLRKDGSTDGRYPGYIQYHEGAIIGVDSNRIAEGYITSFNVDMYLVGYLTMGYFHTLAKDKSTGTTGSFVTVDMTTDAYSSTGYITGALTEFYINASTVNGTVRKYGSTDNHYIQMNHDFPAVGIDSSKRFEQKIADTALDLFVLGYFYHPPSAISAYTYKKELTFNTTSGGANVSSNQTSFPVVVHLNTSSWNNATERDYFFDTNTGCKRIQIFDSDETTNLDYEVEYCNNTEDNEEAVYHVRVPQVDGNSSTDHIHIAYGNEPNGIDMDNKIGVWDSNFKGVWHLGDNSWGSSPEAKDSTININNGTNTGSIDAVGQVRRGRNFDGSDDKLITTYTDSLGITTSFTFSCWVIPDTLTNGRIAIKDPNSGALNRFFYIAHRTTDKILSKVLNADGSVESTITSNGDVLAESPYFISLSYNTSVGSILYLSGIQDNTSNIKPTITPNNSQPLVFGNSQAGDSPYDGTIDEARLSNITRSADWLKLEYYSMKKTNWNGDSWLTWGSQIGGGVTKGWGMILGQ